MKFKITLALLPVFLILLNTQAAIFIPQASNAASSVKTSTISYVDAPKAKDKKTKKVKKIKEGKEKVDRFALWGFVLAVTGLVSFFIFPALGLVLVPAGLGLSVAGLSRTRKNNSTGKGLALAGLVAGSAGILLLILGFILALTVLSNL